MGGFLMILPNQARPLFQLHKAISGEAAFG